MNMVKNKVGPSMGSGKRNFRTHLYSLETNGVPIEFRKNKLFIYVQFKNIFSYISVDLFMITKPLVRYTCYSYIH